jgi:hypothetical protein
VLPDTRRNEVIACGSCATPIGLAHQFLWGDGRARRSDHGHVCVGSTLTELHYRAVGFRLHQLRRKSRLRARRVPGRPRTSCVHGRVSSAPSRMAAANRAAAAGSPLLVDNEAEEISKSLGRCDRSLRPDRRKVRARSRALISAARSGAFRKDGDFSRDAMTPA